MAFWKSYVSTLILVMMAFKITFSPICTHAMAGIVLRIFSGTGWGWCSSGEQPIPRIWLLINTWPLCYRVVQASFSLFALAGLRYVERH